MNFRDALKEELKDEEFRKEYLAIQPEMEIIRMLVKVRKEKNLTQADLALRTGINQADISKLENGSRNPTLNMLKKLADGLNLSLKIEFTPRVMTEQTV